MKYGMNRGRELRKTGSDDKSVPSGLRKALFFLPLGYSCKLTDKKSFYMK